MILYPAIDLKDGACVRLYKGEMDQATVFNDDPAAQAQAFVDQGCDWLHLVDLNGAFAGEPVNAKIMISVPMTDHNMGNGCVGQRTYFFNDLIAHAGHTAPVKNNHAFFTNYECRISHNRKSFFVGSDARPDIGRKFFEMKIKWACECRLRQYRERKPDRHGFK